MTLIRIFQRSKSAPPVNRQKEEYVSTQPQQPMFFTKSHYLAIKQPFSKKYILPPVRTHYMERPVMKRVINYQPQPQRQYIETQQRVVAPPPPVTRQEALKSHVYHVQYQPGPNQTVRYEDDYSKYALQH